MVNDKETTHELNVSIFVSPMQPFQKLIVLFSHDMRTHCINLLALVLNMNLSNRFCLPPFFFLFLLDPVLCNCAKLIRFYHVFGGTLK